MSNLKERVDLYFSSEEFINEQFGFLGEWRQFPLTDARDQFWRIDAHELQYGAEAREAEDDYEYASEVRREHVYRKDGLALVVADTCCDGNIYAYILDESKETKVNV